MARLNRVMSDMARLHVLGLAGVTERRILTPHCVHHTQGAPVDAGEKWGMNIWLRERPNLERLKLVRASTAVRTSGAGAPRVALEIAPTGARCTLGVVPCHVCGDPVGPVGLCFCKKQYGC